MKFIVKLSPEITIKSRAVRLQFVQRLCANIRKVLRHRELGADVTKRWDMIEVGIDRRANETDSSLAQRCEDIAAALAQTPGIAHFYRASELLIDEHSATPQLQQIISQTKTIIGTSLHDKSFAVRCKRQGEHSFGSNDLERALGAELASLNPSAKVSLKKPEVTVLVEIKKHRVFVTTEKISGIGGYPIGNVGQVLSLISGGYDSCVASYQCIQRGMQTHFLFFNLGGLAHEVGVKQAAHFLWERYGSSHRTGFISVAFEEVVEDILEKVSNAYMGVILKRAMMRVATQIAQDMHITALVTGESVAQVSSQTLSNLTQIDRATDILVLRPLIASDKTAIITQAAAIGVDRYAEHMPEYCAVISDKPTTAAKLSRLLDEEQKLDASLLKKVAAERRLCAIDEIYENTALIENVRLASTPAPNDVLIDIRNDREIESNPLSLLHNETLEIPAFRINKAFTELPKEKSYLLFCERGVISKLHAAHLMAEGHCNVAVYMPER